MERDPMEMALSNDIVMDIVLSHLKVIDLLSCRLTSKFWNKAASSVLRKRPTMIKNISDQKCLMKLEECMKKSSDFPFAGLKFDKPWTLNSGRATKFFENYGTRFTRLCVDAHCKGRLDVMVPFIHHLSRLTVLDMALPHSLTLDPRLKRLHSDAELHGGKNLNLSSLRTLSICCPNVAGKVLGEVLLETSPLLQIECLNTTLQIFRALKRAEKVQAVSEMKSDGSDEKSEYQSQMVRWLSIESPSLTKLDFSREGCLSLEGVKKILFSSQQKLKELHLDLDVTNSMGDLGDIWSYFPVLAKLTKLSLCIQIDPYLRYLFRGQYGHNFPVLKELKLVDAYSYKYIPVCSFSNGLFIVPSVKKIDLKGYVSELAMKQLAEVFPNVTDIRLNYVEYGYSSSDPFQLWSIGAFKSLERLEIWNYKVKQPRKDLIGMDSFLTGIPTGICDNLRKHEKLNLVNSRSSKLSRDKPSILQLKNLKELIICLKLEDGLEELREDPPFMSMVSVWYALEMVPNLRVTFTYEVSLPRSSDEERYKAVLEAALKHVRPYVKVEPFFY